MEAPVQILALEVEKPGASSNDLKHLLVDEAHAVWQLYQKDFIRTIHFRADRSTAVLMLECQGIEDAQSTLSKLPLVSAGLIEFEFIPLLPYPGFSRLFTS
jgi:hypothetical protein